MRRTVSRFGNQRRKGLYEQSKSLYRRNLKPSRRVHRVFEGVRNFETDFPTTYLPYDTFDGFSDDEIAQSIEDVVESFEKDKKDLNARYYTLSLDDDFQGSRGLYVIFDDTNYSIEDDYSQYNYLLGVCNVISDCKAFKSTEADIAYAISEEVFHHPADELTMELERLMGMSCEEIWEKADNFFRKEEERRIYDFLNSLCHNYGFVQ